MFAMRQGRSIRPSLILLISIMVIISIYLYLYQMREHNKRLTAVDKCKNELETVKYQLEAVTNYKKKMDSLMIEQQNHGDILQERMKTLTENYLKMKHLLDISEMQNEELVFECTELKTKLAEANKQLATCKKSPG